MATYKYIGGNDGLWTDPQNWDTGTVPLWDYGSDVQLGGSGVTLRDIEPNNMKVDAGAASAGANGAITLDNAAFGPSLVVEVASATPATKPTPSSHFYSDAGAGIRVVGYDTNYGTIEVEHDQSSNGGYFLGITVEPGSQLNNLGTITADGQISDHSNETHLLFENGSGLPWASWTTTARSMCSTTRLPISGWPSPAPARSRSPVRTATSMPATPRS